MGDGEGTSALRAPGGPSTASPYRAVVVDVGGVLLVPDRDWMATQLSEAGVEFDADALVLAHYGGMRAVDAAAGAGESFQGTYLRGCLGAIGVSDEAVQRALDVLAPGLRRPTPLLWTSPVPGSAAGLRSISAAGVPLAVVSNSDGHVEEQLRSASVCQVGEGSGVPVVAVVDSGVVGVSKPDPAIFGPALAAVGVEAAQAVYVGDSVHFDVQGARAARMGALHFDPFGMCDKDDHPHVRSLSEVTCWVAG